MRLIDSVELDPAGIVHSGDMDGRSLDDRFTLSSPPRNGATMATTIAPAHAARVCYFVRFASAVHGGPVDTPIYATSPTEALAIFTADGPAVRVLSVGGPDFTEHDPADLTTEGDAVPSAPHTSDKVRSIYSAPWYGGQVGTIVDTYMGGEMVIVRFPNPAQPGTSATVKLPITVVRPA